MCGEKKLKNHKIWADEMARWWLQAFPALAEDLGVVPSIHMLLTVACDSRPRGPSTLFRPPWALATHTVHILMQVNTLTPKIKILL